MGIAVPIPGSIWHVAEICIDHVKYESPCLSIHAVHVFNEDTKEFSLFDGQLEDMRIYPGVKLRIEVFPAFDVLFSSSTS
jgi:hypothetical protein